MGFDDYKACVPLLNGEMLCFNERTRQMEIVALTVKPADLQSASKDDVMKLKAKLDTLNKQ
jgi:hypothetical protein